MPLLPASFNATSLRATRHPGGTRFETASRLSRLATSFPGRSALCASLLLIGSAWTNAAHALCGTPDPNYPYPATVQVGSFPAVTTLKHVPVGQIMAHYDVDLVVSSVPGWANCASGSPNGQYGLTNPVTTLSPSGIDHVYATGIPGVGIRIRPASASNAYFYITPPPFAAPTPTTNVTLYAPRRLIVEFVRTAMGVGQGELIFDYETRFFIETRTAPTGSFHKIVGTALRTTLQQSTYFSSCHTPAADTRVDMGRAMIAEIKLGQAKEQAFSLDVHCEGMNPTAKPPVEVYLEGNAGRDGVLMLDGAGAAQVAKGVGIAVTDEAGVALPLAKQSTVPLEWQSSRPNVERYRLSGKARYVATDDEITAGKADATLTYVLQYN